MKKELFILALSAVALLSAEDMKITVTCDPALPVRKNYVAGYDFDDGLKKWRVTDKDTTSVVFDQQMNKQVLKLQKAQKSVYRGVPLNLLTPGKYYIASCMIFPAEKINAKKIAGRSGIGFEMTFWRPKWGKGVTVRVFGGGRQEWHKIVGKPVKIPEGKMAIGQLHVSINYSPGTGMICDLCVMEAYAQMAIDVNSPEAPVRQVKVMDDTGRVVFDTGILKGTEKTFKKTIRVETPNKYTIMAVANDGDVQSVDYPAAE